MRLGAFDLPEPLPELRQPHVFTTIPWIDGGAGASLVVARLEERLGATPLARLADPANFFDFTRYRPVLTRTDAGTSLDLPDARVTFSRRNTSPDFIYMHLPEPHLGSREYVNSILGLIQHLGVRRYCLLGSVYTMVPYTRPLMVTGSASTQGLQNVIETAGVISEDYSGPTTVLQLLNQQAAALGIETLSLFVHLPGYLTMEEDHRGLKRLMEVVDALYGIPPAPEDIEKAEAEEEQVRLMSEQFMERHPELRGILKQLEDNYDARLQARQQQTWLSPEVERYLRSLDLGQL